MNERQSRDSNRNTTNAGFVRTNLCLRRRYDRQRTLVSDSNRSDNQKNPRVRKIFVRNSGAGNGCADFMGAWKNAFFLQEKPMSIKFLLLGGGIWGFGGGGVPILFLWAQGFF